MNNIAKKLCIFVLIFIYYNNWKVVEYVKFNPITIVNNKEKNVVLISEDEWKNIEEILYLSSIPGLVDDVNNIKNTENWKNAKEYYLKLIM